MFASVGKKMTDQEPQELQKEAIETFSLMPRAPDNETVIGVPEDENAQLALRHNINRLEQALYACIANGAEEFDCEDDRFLTHRFIEGVYARELLIPADTVVIGKLHKWPRICIISGGDCTFVTEFGTRRVQAPFTEVMSPGTKTAVYAHTDTTWTAIHGTHERDMDRLEQIFIAPDHESYQRFLEQEV